MSTFDEDEALFEDIYGDEPEQKQESSANTSAPTVESKSNDAPPANDSSSAAAPPPPPPPPPIQPEQNSTSSHNQFSVPQPGTQPGAQLDAQQGAHSMPQFQAQPQQGEYYGQNAGTTYAQQAPPVVHQPSNIGKESGKMFIGGLNWDTSEEGLVSYFSKFGEVLDHTIMRDNNTGKSRGFGFLTFKDPKSVDEVIKTDHILDGKLIDPKRAIARDEQDKVGKIFVGGIDPMVNEKDFNEFFSQFGSIIDAQLMIDKDTGRSRGFGFITYDSPEAVDRVTVNKYLTLKGKTMEVKRAEPRGQHQQNQQQNQHQNQYNNYASYGNQYGQTQYGQQQQQQPQQMAAYGQAMNMSPEMMQDYWQRMQQWYLYQQQVASGQVPEGGETGEAGEGTDGAEKHDQPLNPQQQGYDDNNQESGQGHDGRPQPPRGPRDHDNRNGGWDNRRDYDNNPHRDGRRNNLPKGPRRAPPSGPAGGNGGRPDNRRRRGGGGRERGGDRGYHPYSRGGGRGGRDR